MVKSGYFRKQLNSDREECGGSVVDCLTGDGGVVGRSLTRGTALCP